MKRVNPICPTVVGVVDPGKVTEISDLIAAQRAYEMNAKVISAADQMMQSIAYLFR